jgi:hypothetical protein
VDHETRRFLMRLGFTAAIPRERCHGYANTCQCKDCLERAEAPRAKRMSAQPWEPRESRRAA